MLHYRPIKDPETGALVLSLVQKVSQPKSLNGFQNLKWSSLAKIQKNKSSQHDCIIPVLEVGGRYLYQNFYLIYSHSVIYGYYYKISHKRFKTFQSAKHLPSLDILWLSELSYTY